MDRRKVTITLDEETARWARLEAAKARFLAIEPYLISRPGGFLSREETHDRKGLRG